MRIAIKPKQTIQKSRGSIFGQALSAFPRMYDRLVAVSCWMPEASSRVPPELSCQTEEKNRCREINVFLDVNRIWPKNPYIERILEISWCSSTTQRVHDQLSTTKCVLSVVTKAMISNVVDPHFYSAFIPRRSMIFRDGLEKTVSNSSFSFVFLSSSCFCRIDSTDTVGHFIGWNKVGNCVILFMLAWHTRIIGAVDACVLWRLRLWISHMERCQLIVDFGASF